MRSGDNMRPPSFAPDVRRQIAPNHPIPDCFYYRSSGEGPWIMALDHGPESWSLDRRPRRSALGLAERTGEGEREACFFGRAQKAGDCQSPATRNQEKPFDTEFLVHDALEPHPQRI